MSRTLPASLAEARSDIAYNDDLTGLFSRRVLSLVAEREWAALLEEHGTLSVIVIDLDHFKEVNDIHGHLAGDEVLRETASILRSHFRGNDILVRYGGDEFIVILPGAGEAEAGKLATRARSALHEHRFAAIAEGPALASAVSFSLGVAVYPADGKDLKALVDLADRRLLEDKRARRGDDNRSPTAAKESRKVLLGAAAIAMMLIATGLWLLQRQAVQLRSPAVVRGLDPAREAALLAQVKALQEQLAAVNAERSRATDAGTRQSSDRKIEEYRAKIAELEQQLGHGAAPPAPGSNVTPETASTPAGPVPPTHPPDHAAEAASTAVPASQSPPAESILPAVEEVPPVLVHYERPEYPEPARRHSQEASVELRVLVDARGKVVQVELVGAPVGFGFDQAARNAAFRCRYRPGTRNGEPVEMLATLVVNFKLAPGQ